MSESIASALARLTNPAPPGDGGLRGRSALDQPRSAGGPCRAARALCRPRTPGESPAGRGTVPTPKPPQKHKKGSWSSSEPIYSSSSGEPVYSSSSSQVLGSTGPESILQNIDIYVPLVPPLSSSSSLCFPTHFDATPFDLVQPPVHPRLLYTCLPTSLSAHTPPSSPFPPLAALLDHGAPSKRATPAISSSPNSHRLMASTPINLRPAHLLSSLRTQSSPATSGSHWRSTEG